MAERVEGLGGRIVLAYLVTGEDLQSKYDAIVGADGPNSVVAQWVGRPKLQPCDVHFGVQRIIIWDWHPKETVGIYFGRKVAPNGYAWIFPDSGNRVKVGLGVPLSERVNPRKLLDHFLEKRQVYDYREVNFVAKLIPTAKFPSSGVYGRVLLVGDALPSTDPFTGGGIVQGIASGKAAGRAIAEGEPRRYDSYIAWLRRQNAWRYRLKRVLYSFSDRDFNDLIQVLKSFKPRSMGLGKELRRATLHLLVRKRRILHKFFKMFG